MARLILRTTPLLLAIVLAATAAVAAPPQTHIVVGQNNAAVDRGAIQSAIDGAAPGDTVELRGTFQLDGVPILLRTTRLTLAGEALDNDLDGQVNEDGADGVDNDGDGLVDEDDRDAALVGVDDGSGGPAGDNFPARFNDGIEILGLDEDLRSITIRDLKFSKLNRSIYLFPDYDDGGTPLLCDSSVPTPGAVDHVDIVDNTFENSLRGVELAGRVSDARVQDNLFVSILVQAVIMFGQELGCAEADGSIEQLLPLDGPAGTRVVDNRIVNVRVGVFSLVTTGTTVRDNVFEAPFFAVVSLEDEKLAVAHNEINGAVVGYFAAQEPFVDGPSSGNSFSNNEVSSSVFGALVDCETTGHTMVNNDYQGNFVADVLLDGASPGGICAPGGDSFGNTVIATDFETFVLDFGMDNNLLGTLASSNNPAAARAQVEAEAGSMPSQP